MLRNLGEQVLSLLLSPSDQRGYAKIGLRNICLQQILHATLGLIVESILWDKILLETKIACWSTLVNLQLALSNNLISLS